MKKQTLASMKKKEIKDTRKKARKAKNFVKYLSLSA